MAILPVRRAKPGNNEGRKKKACSFLKFGEAMSAGCYMYPVNYTQEPLVGECGLSAHGGSVLPRPMLPVMQGRHARPFDKGPVEGRRVGIAEIAGDRRHVIRENRR